MSAGGQDVILSVQLPSLASTGALGARIAAGLAPGSAVALEGDLGAGKTTLARAILAALGVAGPVPSPSFSLVQTYETPRLAISHVDLYRIEHGEELEELGLEDILAAGATLIEWPELAAPFLPVDTLHVQLTASSQAMRLAHMRGPARWAEFLRQSGTDAG